MNVRTKGWSAIEKSPLRRCDCWPRWVEGCKIVMIDNPRNSRKVNGSRKQPEVDDSRDQGIEKEKGD